MVAAISCLDVYCRFAFESASRAVAIATLPRQNELLTKTLVTASLFDDELVVRMAADAGMNPA